MQPLPSSPDGASYPSRPPLDPTPLFSSDESTSTLASLSSFESSTSSLEHPYSRLVIQDRSSSPRRAFDLDRSPSYDDRGSQSLPSSRTSSFTQQERESLVPLRALREGRTESFSAAPPPRHQSLAPLLSVPLPSSPSSSSPSSTHSHSSTASFSSSSSAPPSINPAPSSEPDASPTTTYFPRTRLLTRSHSFGSAPRPDPRSPSYPTASPFAASPFTYPSIPNSISHSSSVGGGSLGGRPASSGTGSTTTSSGSSRPWVRDSDASSVASGGSCQSEEAEVYRVAEGDVVEFLDPRPEPPGAKLTVDREDPNQVVVHVVLPGFSLDNITVAMRRGYKVHIVADSYGENGGHFEKLISLGSDVSSAAPRAEFNGTELHVYVARRKPSSPLPPPPHSTPSASSSTTPTPATNDEPIVTRSTAPGGIKAKAKVGPEGAKAAAKAAREEAANRAKEAAKVLPKVGGRRVPFAVKEDWGEKGKGVERSGTVTQRSHSSELLGAGERMERSRSGEVAGARGGGEKAEGMGRSVSSEGVGEAGSFSSEVVGEGTRAGEGRPRLRPGSLTLRAGEDGFLEAAREEEGGRTPRGEVGGMRFEMGTAL